MAKRIIKETPLDKGKRPAIDLPTGGKMEFPEPAKLIEETVELDAAETALLDQLVKEKAAQQPQEVQQAQPSSSGEPIKGNLGATLAKTTTAIDSFLKEPEIAETIAQQEEMQRLTQLPLSQIEELPQEKRELVWQELARQIVEKPILVDEIAAIIDVSKKAIEAGTSITKWATQPLEECRSNLLQQLANIKESASTAIEAIRERVANLRLSEDNIEAIKTLAILSPYIEAELAENSDGDSGLPVTTLVAAAARRARADGKEIPPLKAEEEPEQLQMQLDLPDEKEETRRKHIEEARQRREQAQAEGVFETTSSNLATIAEKGLGFSYFTSAVIKSLPGGVEMKDLMLDKEGKINLYDLTQQGRELEEVDRVHTGFLMWLLGLAYHNSDLRETNSNTPTIPVNVPAVLTKMGIDPRPRLRQLNTETNKKELARRQDGLDMADLRRDRFMEFLRPFLNMAAFFGEDLYQIIGFQSYNKATETIQIAIPYLFKLVEYSKLHATRHGAIVNIFHADIMTENQTAVEVANRIAMGVLLRGLRPDMKTYKNAATPQAKKTVQKTSLDADGNPVTVVIDAPPRVTTWAPKFSSLIKDCPQFEKELNGIRTSTGAAETAVIEAAKKAGKEPDAKEIEEARKADHKIDPQRINKKLKDVFDAAIRIIMEKSDMPDYYAGFKIRTGKYDTFKSPTGSTLNDKLIITHKGKNPHYHGN